LYNIAKAPDKGKTPIKQANNAIKNHSQYLPLAQAAMFHQPSNKAMMVCLFSSSLSGSLLLILLLKLYQVKSFIYGKALIQEGVDEQIKVLLLHVKVLLSIISSTYAC
jgi:hypothetical protein